jgi:hypothetical protein
MGSVHDHLVAWPQAATNHQREDGTDDGHLRDRALEVRNAPSEIDEPTRTSAVGIKRGASTAPLSHGDSRSDELQ